MKKISFIFLMTFLSISSLAGTQDIMLTGYWPITNEMLRPFSQNAIQNLNGWKGKNWENLGYDIHAYFPEFPEGSWPQGEGDFEVDYEDTASDFIRITEKLKPIAILSFGRGEGPWEIEMNFQNFRDEEGEFSYNSTLPVFEIADAVNELGELKAWVDVNGSAGSYLCEYIGFLGARYHQRHSDPSDPARSIASGFIHVDNGMSLEVYRNALNVTLKELIKRTVSVMRLTESISK